MRLKWVDHFQVDEPLAEVDPADFPVIAGDLDLVGGAPGMYGGVS
jgi:hypothetical protein